jgi:NCAIR mutase (PurE)-related protein
MTMTSQKIKRLLQDVRMGRKSVEEAMTALRHLPFEDIGFAKIDHHRALRCGVSEVIFCQGKTPEQVAEISRRILREGHALLATRATPEHYAAVREVADNAEYCEIARCVVVRKGRVKPRGFVLILTAGTSDLPVATEAQTTAEMLGARVELISDVGVAGIHRLLNYMPRLHEANVVVVVAGMEGALASVVGGMVSRPVIAVPTSVGYGASFGGIAPLLTMLNSCAAGVAVVNIDNGFGAGYMAALINDMASGAPGVARPRRKRNSGKER